MSDSCFSHEKTKNIKKKSKGILQFGESTEPKFSIDKNKDQDRQHELIKNVHLQQQFERFEQKMKNREHKKDEKKDQDSHSSDEESSRAKKRAKRGNSDAADKRRQEQATIMAVQHHQQQIENIKNYHKTLTFEFRKQ